MNFEILSDRAATDRKLRPGDRVRDALLRRQSSVKDTVTAVQSVLFNWDGGAPDTLLLAPSSPANRDFRSVFEHRAQRIHCFTLHPHQPGFQKVSKSH
jgi:hypothetical protein